jgi:hypothetical protein
MGKSKSEAVMDSTEFGSTESTNFAGQLGFNVNVLQGINKIFLSVFCDSLESDNVRIKVLHGHKEEELLNVTVEQSNYKAPSVSFSDNGLYCYVAFDNCVVHIHITDEGVVIDVWDDKCEDGSIDTTYLFDEELFE